MFSWLISFPNKLIHKMVYPSIYIYSHTLSVDHIWLCIKCCSILCAMFMKKEKDQHFRQGKLENCERIHQSAANWNFRTNIIDIEYKLILERCIGHQRKITKRAFNGYSTEDSLFGSSQWTFRFAHRSMWVVSHISKFLDMWHYSFRKFFR
jgi:hypothetical protein